VHCVRGSDRLRSRLAQADVAHLPLSHELRQGPDRFLDGHVRVDAVLVVDVDAVGAEALERRFGRAPYVLRGSVEHSPGRVVRVHAHAELRRYHHLVAPARHRAADQLLIGVGAVHLGRVQEVHPELDRALDRRGRLVLVGGAVERRHPHAAESDRGHLEAGCPELALLHVAPFSRFDLSGHGRNSSAL
jgi:hypothetical protein